MPNQDDGQMVRIWSLVSKAAERSVRQRYDVVWACVTLIRWSEMYRRALSLQWCCNKQIGEDLEGCLKTDDQLGL